MKKADPAELRKSIKSGYTMMKAGIDFVCIPVKTENQKDDLLRVQKTVLEEMIREAEQQ
ncbi:DUF1382 family protein [Oceanobacter sp. 4_MG-2023]|uniref:DUF1382 family protein n=1 Tax=Oceanobacter sp. 4_MG-2023 TaxID=3062623 RepID=UPI002733B922|nr:DUF1382 family protein [Oceanobacter sp. 4_MG-2023]MDP2548885.1 DUF1382 family protein [Oceanobacter sp. 4_MG-2023]